MVIFPALCMGLQQSACENACKGFPVKLQVGEHEGQGQKGVAGVNQHNMTVHDGDSARRTAVVVAVEAVNVVVDD